MSGFVDVSEGGVVFEGGDISVMEEVSLDRGECVSKIF